MPLIEGLTVISKFSPHDFQLTPVLTVIVRAAGFASFSVSQMLHLECAKFLALFLYTINYTFHIFVKHGKQGFVIWMQTKHHQFDSQKQESRRVLNLVTFLQVHLRQSGQWGLYQGDLLLELLQM